MPDISGLIEWVEKRYGVKVPKIIWTPEFPGPGQDAYFCPGVTCSVPHPPTIVIWSGTPIPEELFLHEFQHFLRQKEEQRMHPDLKEKWADYLAQCDLLRYRIEKDAQKDFEEYRTNVSSG